MVWVPINVTERPPLATKPLVPQASSLSGETTQLLLSVSLETVKPIINNYFVLLFDLEARGRSFLFWGGG